MAAKHGGCGGGTLEELPNLEPSLRHALKDWIKPIIDEHPSNAKQDTYTATPFPVAGWATK